MSKPSQKPRKTRTTQNVRTASREIECTVCGGKFSSLGLAKHMDTHRLIKQRTLIVVQKKEEQKYFILLSDQTVIIDTEFAAMKKARKSGKTIWEMLKTDARLIAQTTGLTNLLETLDREKVRAY